jgi:hypothetical protein
MKEGGSQASSGWRYEVMLGAPLSQPGWVRDNILFMPVGLAVGFGLILYLPSFSRVVFWLALVVWPAMTTWSVALFVWAGRHRTNGAAGDRRVLLETTGVFLPYQAFAAPVVGLLFTSIGVRCLQVQWLPGSWVVTLTLFVYVAALGLSYLFLSDVLVRLELQRIQLSPSTLLGRLLAPGMPNLVPWAILGVVLSMVLVRVGGAALLAGTCFLLVSPYLIHASVVNLERWRRFRRFMQAERERWRDEAAEG